MVKNKLSKEEYRERVKKYFIQQKAKEISIFLIVVAAIILIPLVLSMFVIGTLRCEETGSPTTVLINVDIAECEGEVVEASFGEIYFGGVLLLMLVLIAGFILWLIILMLWSWIKDNWEEAEERVNEELGGSK